MKICVFISLLLATMSSSSPVFGASTEILRLRADSWMPYNGEPGSPLPGYAIELASEICARNGIALDYEIMSWDAALAAAAANQIEAVVGAKQNEASGLVRCEVEIGFARDALVVRSSDEWSFQGVNSLRNVRLAVMKGYKYWPALDQYVASTPGPHVISFDGEHPLIDALGKLRDREVDVVAETSSVLAWATKSAGYPPRSFRIAYLHQGDPVYFAFSPGSARYAKMFDAALRTMRANGELAEILRRYGQIDWD